MPIEAPPQSQAMARQIVLPSRADISEPLHSSVQSRNPTAAPRITHTPQRQVVVGLGDDIVRESTLFPAFTRILKRKVDKHYNRLSEYRPQIANVGHPAVEWTNLLQYLEHVEKKDRDEQMSIWPAGSETSQKAFDRDLSRLRRN